VAPRARAHPGRGRNRITFKMARLRADQLRMSRSTDLVSDVHWTKLALCAGHPERGWWFPEYYCDKDVARAVAICRACPVRTDCLNFAITTGQSEGVWGGTTPSERRNLRREIRRAQ
jgi:WhiB family transcriptional regulator, redox-sensing transcriptional regulator